MEKSLAFHKSTLARIGAVVLVLLLLLYFGLGYFVYERLTTVTPGASVNLPNTPDNFKVRGTSAHVDFDTAPYLLPATYQAVRIPSRESGITLAGWYVERTPSAPVVLVTHGFPQCKCDSNVLLPAGMLYRNGFNVLLIDLRNHGESDAPTRHASYGSREYLDVLGAWEWLQREKRFAPQRIGLLGVSMGASTTLIALGQEPRASGAWLDSPFADLSELVGDQLVQENLPAFLALGSILIGRVTGNDLLAHSPQEGIRNDNGRSLLFVQGTADRKVEPHQHRELMALAQQLHANATEWVVDGAAHVESALTEPVEYERRLTAFFTALLGN